QQPPIPKMLIEDAQIAIESRLAGVTNQRAARDQHPSGPLNKPFVQRLGLVAIRWISQDQWHAIVRNVGEHLPTISEATLHAVRKQRGVARRFAPLLGFLSRRCLDVSPTRERGSFCARQLNW